MSIINDDNIVEQKITEAKENDFDHSDNELIPEFRSFNLYMMLFSGMVVFGLALYLYFYPGIIEGNVYFDGESFVGGKLNWQILCYVATVISAFPVYHLIKGSHKVKQKK